MRKIVSAFITAAAVTGTALIAASAGAVTPPTVTFAVAGDRVVGSATHLPQGMKSCTFTRSNPDPGPIFGSFGNDMVPVGGRRTSGDAVTITSHRVPAGRYYLRMSCFIKNDKTGMYDIVALNEQWVRVAARR